MGMTAREFIISVSDKLACSDNGNPCLDTSGGLGLTAREFITYVLDKLACSDAPIFNLHMTRVKWSSLVTFTLNMALP